MRAPVHVSLCHVMLLSQLREVRPVATRGHSLHSLSPRLRLHLRRRSHHTVFLPFIHHSPTPRCSPATQITREHHKVLICPTPSRHHLSRKAPSARPSAPKTKHPPFSVAS